jgi:hypothetical protein
VVTRYAKGLAWVTVVAINLFFIYFSMLRGLQRGLDWQRSYMMGCILRKLSTPYVLPIIHLCLLSISVLELILEIVVYETSECAIVNFIIPSTILLFTIYIHYNSACVYMWYVGLATAEVNSARAAINQAIDIICSSTPPTYPIILDAPRYLFVSANLASKFPSLLESVIISSYHSCTPGVFSRLWRFNQPLDAPWWVIGRENGNRGKTLLITSIILAGLQSLGASSATLQRLVIHGVQPLFVSALYLFWIILYRYPIWWAVVGPTIFLFVVSAVWAHVKRGQGQVKDDKDAILFSPILQLSRNVEEDRVNLNKDKENQEVPWSDDSGEDQKVDESCEDVSSSSWINHSLGSIGHSEDSSSIDSAHPHLELESDDGRYRRGSLDSLGASESDWRGGIQSNGESSAGDESEGLVEVGWGVL